MSLVLSQPAVDEIDRRILDAIFANKNNKSSTARQLARLQTTLSQSPSFEILVDQLPGLRADRAIDINFRNHLEAGRYPQLTLWEESDSGRKSKTLLPAPQDLRWVTLFVASELLRSERYDRVNGFGGLSSGELRSLVGELVLWLRAVGERHTRPGRTPSRESGVASPPVGGPEEVETAESAPAGGDESELINRLASELHNEWRLLPRDLRGELDRDWASALFARLGKLALHDAERRHWILKLNQTPPLDWDAPLGEALRALGDKTGRHGWLPELQDHRRLQLSLLLRLLGRRADVLASSGPDSSSLAAFLLDFTEEPTETPGSSSMPGFQSARRVDRQGAAG